MKRGVDKHSVHRSGERLKKLERISVLMHRLAVVWPHWDSIQSGAFIFEGERYTPDRLLIDCLETYMLGREYDEINLSGIESFLIASESKLLALAKQGELISMLQRIKQPMIDLH